MIIGILCVVLFILLIFLIVHRAFHSASIYMGDSFRWGGRDNRDET